MSLLSPIIQRVQLYRGRRTEMLANAINREDGKESLSSRKCSRIFAISNKRLKLDAHLNAASKLDRNLHTNQAKEASRTPIAEAFKALDAGLLAVRNISVGNDAKQSLDNVLARVSDKIGRARAEWTKLYWRNYEFDRPNDAQSNIVKSAESCLGAAPDPSTLIPGVFEGSLLETFELMAGSQEATLPQNSLNVITSRFNEIYCIADPDDYRGEGNARDYRPAVRCIADFRDIPSAIRDLAGIRAFVEGSVSPRLKPQLFELLQTFDKRANRDMGHWVRQEQRAQSEGMSDTEAQKLLHEAQAWLGKIKVPNAAAEDTAPAQTENTGGESPTMHASGPSGVDSQPTPLQTPPMTLTEAFKAAAETHGLTNSQLKELEDWAVATLALPNRSASEDAPYVPGDFPPLGQGKEGTNLLLAQSELSELLNAVAAPPAKPTGAPLLCLLADLQLRVSDTLIHWHSRRDQLIKGQERVPTFGGAAEIERIENFIGATSGDTDLDDVSQAGSSDSYSTMDSFGTESPGRMSSINLYGDESIGDVDDLFDSSSSISWESDTGSESARYDQSSLAGFDLPFTKLPTSGGVYFGDTGRIINTRKMTLEEAFATKLLNESISTTTIDKLDTIFERQYGITLATSGLPRFELSSFANPFKKGLRRPHEGLDDIASISRRLDQMRPSQAQDDLRRTLALYQTHLKEAGNWWRAEAQRLAENPPPAARTDLQEMHALQLDVAMAWLADSDA